MSTDQTERAARAEQAAKNAKNGLREASDDAAALNRILAERDRLKAEAEG